MAKKSKKRKILANLDEVNVGLKIKFNVKHINYVTDNGIIKFGWLISSEAAIDEAIGLLKVQNAPMYILGQYASAIIKWNTIKINVLGTLYKEGKQIDEFKTDNFDEMKLKIQAWYNFVVKGVEYDL